MEACHLSDTSMVRHFVGPTKKIHCSDISVVRHVISPTCRWSDKTHLSDTSVVRQFGDVSLVRHVVGPTTNKYLPVLWKYRTNKWNEYIWSWAALPVDDDGNPSPIVQFVSLTIPIKIILRNIWGSMFLQLILTKKSVQFSNSSWDVLYYENIVGASDVSFIASQFTKRNHLNPETYQLNLLTDTSPAMKTPYKWMGWLTFCKHIFHRNSSYMW